MSNSHLFYQTYALMGTFFRPPNIEQSREAHTAFFAWVGWSNIGSLAAGLAGPIPTVLVGWQHSVLVLVSRPANFPSLEVQIRNRPSCTSCLINLC